MKCKTCNNKKYIEVEVTYPVSFLPGVGYVCKERQPCKECSNGRDYSSRSSNAETPTSDGGSVAGRRV